MKRTPNLGEHHAMKDPNLPNFHLWIKRLYHGSKLGITPPLIKRWWAQRFGVIGVLATETLLQIPLPKPAGETFCFSFGRQASIQMWQFRHSTVPSLKAAQPENFRRHTFLATTQEHLLELSQKFLQVLGGGFTRIFGLHLTCERVELFLCLFGRFIQLGLAASGGA
jgi:hypothetical protein